MKKMLMLREPNPKIVCLHLLLSQPTMLMILTDTMMAGKKTPTHSVHQVHLKANLKTPLSVSTCPSQQALLLSLGLTSFRS